MSEQAPHWYSASQDCTPVQHASICDRGRALALRVPPGRRGVRCAPPFRWNDGGARASRGHHDRSTSKAALVCPCG
jgi:hypothetical protein